VSVNSPRLRLLPTRTSSWLDSSRMTDPNERPFSPAWVFLSVVLFLAVEFVIGTWLGPAIIGKYVSPMFHLQVQMVMHLASLSLGARWSAW